MWISVYYSVIAYTNFSVISVLKFVHIIESRPKDVVHMVQVSHSNHQASQESWLPSMNLSAFCPVPISCPSSWADKGSWPKCVPHSCWLWMRFSSAILERSDCWCISVYMLAFQEEWVFGDFMMSDTCVIVKVWTKFPEFAWKTEN